MDHLRHLFDAVPPAAVYAVTPFVTVALVLSFVTVYTRWQYYQSLRQFVHGPIPGKQQLVESPQIPYTIPILGNTLSFLAPRPGQYWDQLFTGHPRSTGICTLLLGGRKTHILFGDVNVGVAPYGESLLTSRQYVISNPSFQNRWRSGIYCEGVCVEASATDHPTVSWCS